MATSTIEGWKRKRISEVCLIISGGTPSTQEPELWNGSIPWATPTDITKNGKFIDKTEKTISEKGLKNSSATLLPINSILMTSRATIGARCINLVPMTTNQGFKSFVCNKSEINYEFLYYLIEILHKDFIALASGSTFLEISKKSIDSFIVDLPPLPEQKKIAEILSTWDEAIELKKQQLKLYEDYLSLCLKKMFEARDKKLGLALGRLIVEEGKTKNQSSSRGFSGAYPFFTNSTEEVAKKTDYFDFDGKYIIANTGGKAYFDYFEGKFGAMSDCYVFTTKEINVKYLYYFLKRLEKYVDFVGFVGSGLKHLDKKWFKKISIPVPSKTRQEKVVEVLDSIKIAKEIINKQISLLILHKQGLMQRLLTGKVRVKLD